MSQPAHRSQQTLFDAAAAKSRPEPAAARSRHETVAAKSRQEAAEREDPLNELLDGLERLIGAAQGLGAEAALRARLARLLPPAQVTAAAGVPAAAEDGDEVGERMMRNAVIRQALGIVAGSVRSGTNRKIVEQAMGYADGEMARLLAVARANAAGRAA